MIYNEEMICNEVIFNRHLAYLCVLSGE